MHLVLQEELRQEHGERVSAQALVEQHKQQLADLKLEASVLRQASAEHARFHQLPSCHLSVCTQLCYESDSKQYLILESKYDNRMQPDTACTSCQQCFERVCWFQSLLSILLSIVLRVTHTLVQACLGCACLCSLLASAHAACPLNCAQYSDPCHTSPNLRCAQGKLMLFFDSFWNLFSKF